jgi:hypothetical protein
MLHFNHDASFKHALASTSDCSVWDSATIRQWSPSHVSSPPSCCVTAISLLPWFTSMTPTTASVYVSLVVMWLQPQLRHFQIKNVDRVSFGLRKTRGLRVFKLIRRFAHNSWAQQWYRRAQTAPCVFNCVDLIQNGWIYGWPRCCLGVSSNGVTLVPQCPPKVVFSPLTAMFLAAPLKFNPAKLLLFDEFSKSSHRLLLHLSRRTTFCGSNFS